jgi:drug/metabolite transporter (DMT)-like permease
MPAKWFLLFPLIAAVMYAFAALSLKQAERRGVRATRITVLSNFALAAAFVPFYPWREFPRMLPAVYWPVLAAGVTFAVGQLLTILAFAKGEVSVATPTLGTKAVFVALVTAAFTEKHVSPATWKAAALMAAGLWLLVGWPAHADRRRVLFAVVCSLAAAFAYACFDTIVGTWSRPLGFGRLVPAAVLVGSLLSLPLLWVGRQPSDPSREQASGTGLFPLVIGLTLMSVQSLLLIGSIGWFGNAADANVVYASRGIWSVLLVQGLAASVVAGGGDAESFHSGREFVRRLCGAGVMMAGVVLAFTA